MSKSRSIVEEPCLRGNETSDCGMKGEKLRLRSEVDEYTGLTGSVTTSAALAFMFRTDFSFAWALKYRIDDAL